MGPHQKSPAQSGVLMAVEIRFFLTISALLQILGTSLACVPSYWLHNCLILRH